MPSEEERETQKKISLYALLALMFSEKRESDTHKESKESEEERERSRERQRERVNV